MQYLLMCCIDEELWAKLPETVKANVMRDYDELLKEVGKKGQLRASMKLAPGSASTTVRQRDGRRVVTDGPFAETKEQLGGFHLVECKDLDEALAIAARIPPVRVGGSVEVRPVEYAVMG
jgi:hypothetical protein